MTTHFLFFLSFVILMHSQLNAQDFRGTVSDRDNNALSDVLILTESGCKSTSNNDGTFSTLNGSQKYLLYKLGYEIREVRVSQTTNVQLEKLVRKTTVVNDQIFTPTKMSIRLELARKFAESRFNPELYIVEFDTSKLILFSEFRIEGDYLVSNFDINPNFEKRDKLRAWVILGEHYKPIIKPIQNRTIRITENEVINSRKTLKFNLTLLDVNGKPVSGFLKSRHFGFNENDLGNQSIINGKASFNIDFPIENHLDVTYFNEDLHIEKKIIEHELLQPCSTIFSKEIKLNFDYNKKLMDKKYKVGKIKIRPTIFGGKVLKFAQRIIPAEPITMPKKESTTFNTDLLTEINLKQPKKEFVFNVSKPKNNFKDFYLISSILNFEKIGGSRFNLRTKISWVAGTFGFGLTFNPIYSLSNRFNFYFSGFFINHGANLQNKVNGSLEILIGGRRGLGKSESKIDNGKLMLDFQVGYKWISFVDIENRYHFKPIRMGRLGVEYALKKKIQFFTLRSLILHYSRDFDNVFKHNILFALKFPLK